MMDIILDFLDIETKDDLHEYLKQQLRLPDYYGKNLDALHDCITDMPVDIAVTVEHFDCLRKTLGDYADSLLTVLQDGCAFVRVK